MKTTDYSTLPAKDATTFLSTTEKDRQKQTSDPGVVIGSTVASLILLLVIAAVFLYMRNRMSKDPGSLLYFNRSMS